MQVLNLLTNIVSIFKALVILLLMGNFANSALTIEKRGEIPSTATVNNFCVEPETKAKLSCSQVLGELKKLDVGENGYFRLNSTNYLAPNEFCVLSGNTKYGKICSILAPSQPPWRKCCKENEILDATSFKCRRTLVKFRPKTKNDTFQSFVVPGNNSATGTTIVGGNTSLGGDFTCPQKFTPKIFSTSMCLLKSNGFFQRLDNGSLAYESSSGVFLRKTHFKYADNGAHYCVDGVMDITSTNCGYSDNEIDGSSHHSDDYSYETGLRGDGSFINPCKSSTMEEILIVCMEEQELILNEDDGDIPKAYFFAALWLSTCPLLLTSAIVNSCIIQKNVHGWILSSYLISMFLVNINSVILILDVHIPISSSQNILPNHGGCGLQDFTMKFIYLSSLCWMSSMCMNMLRTFSSSVPHVAIRPNRFLMSALFSLGFPVVIVSLSYFVGSLPDSTTSVPHGRDGESNPGTSPSSLTSCTKSACALYSYKTIPFYSGPIIFLVFCNVVAFLKTSTSIATLRREAENVLHQQTKDHLESFALFAKLFLLTGSIWIIRVVLLVLQIKGLYITWYGVALEAVFSIPEVVFPMIIFHHREFIKWACRKFPLISRTLLKCCPDCTNAIILKGRPAISLDSQSAFQMNNLDRQNQVSWSHSNPSSGPAVVTSNTTLSTSSHTGSNGISTRNEASMV